MKNRNDPCTHEWVWKPSINEDGWHCFFCSVKPGEPAGYSPQIDRDLLEEKIEQIISTLHDSQLLYISNNDYAIYLINAVKNLCQENKKFDQYSIVEYIFRELSDHGDYWKIIGDNILAGNDQRARCLCGQLATCFRSSGGQKTYSCYKHNC